MQDTTKTAGSFDTQPKATELIGQLFEKVQHPTERSDAPWATHWGPSVWYRRRDDGQHFTIRLNHPIHAWCHTVCHLVLHADGRPEIYCAFATDILDYALPEDFDAQETVNSQLANALDTQLGGRFADAGFGDAVRADWQVSKERIERRWAENAQAGMGTDRLSFYLENGVEKPAIAVASTRLGQQHLVGVALNHHNGKYEKISRVHQNAATKAGYFTHKSLTKQDQFSSAEKMEILQGSDAQYPRALLSFQAARKSHSSAHPMPNKSVADTRTDTHQQFRTKITHQNSDEVETFASKTTSHARYFSGEVAFPRTKLNISISLWPKEKGWTIERGSTNEVRFTSAQLLDECLTLALRYILDVDPDWPSWMTAHFADGFEPGHPILAGRAVPPRHQGFVAAVLAQPYQKAHQAATRFAAQRAKKAKAKESPAAQPEQYPDGTLFAGLRKGVKPDAADLTSRDIKILYSVQTESAPGAKRRRRVLVGLGGEHGDKPFTPRNIANKVALTNPHAVRTLTDYALGSDARDLVEVAFKLALELPPMAENPILSGDCDLSKMPTGHVDVDIRVTRVVTQVDHSLLALRVIRKAREQNYFYDDASHGVAFVTTPKGDQTYLLSSVLPEADQQFDDDADLLRQTITNTQGAASQDLLRRFKIAIAAPSIRLV